MRTNIARMFLAGIATVLNNDAVVGAFKKKKIVREYYNAEVDLSDFVQPVNTYQVKERNRKRARKAGRRK